MPTPRLYDIENGKKLCRSCGERLPTSAFSKCLSHYSGLQSNCRKCFAAFYVSNKSRIDERNRAWYAANRERDLQKYKEWYSKNRDRDLAKGREWRKNNKARANQASRAWAANNPDKIWWTNKRREVREAIAPPFPYTVDNPAYRVRKELFDGWCWYCCMVPTGHRKRGETLDHGQPLSKGGTNHPENLFWVCWEHQRRKNSATLVGFLRKLWSEKQGLKTCTSTCSLSSSPPPSP